MKRFFGLTIALLLFGLDAAPGWTQYYGTFDCKKLLVEIGFASEDGRSRPDIVLVPPGNSAPQGSDPVSVRELLSDGAPFLLYAQPKQLETRSSRSFLGCFLIVVEFFETLEPESRLRLDENEEHGSGWRIPILLAGLFNTEDDAYSAGVRWQEANYSIQTIFSRFSTGDSRVILEGRRFSEQSFLGLSSNSSGRSRVVDASRAPEDVQSFLASADARGANSMLVLCGGETCAQLGRLINPEGSEAETPAPGPETLASGANRSGTGFEFSLNTDPPATDSPHTDGSLQAGAGVITQVPRPSETPSSATFNITAHIQWKNGRTNDEALQKLQALDCLLIALGAEFFANSSNCEAYLVAMDEIRNLDALVEIQPTGDWRLIEGARFKPPREVVLTLPKGFDAAPCQFDVFYTTEVETRHSVQMDPVPRSEAPQYRAEIIQPMQVRGNEVTIDINHVGAEGVCPFDSQVFTLDSDEILDVSLAARDNKRASVAHVLLLHGTDLTEDLGLSGGQASDLARKTIDALEGAHARVAAILGGTSWPLAETQVGALRANNRVEVLAVLNAADLRNRVSGSFEDIPVGTRERLAQNQLALSGDRLAIALQPLLDRAVELELSDLTVTLIGHVQQSSVTGIVDPCNEPFVEDAAVALNARKGPRVRLILFPVHKLRSEDRLSTADLRPIGFNAGGNVAGGAFECSDTPKDVEIYPFLVEPWRASVDISARYSTALSDQVALILEGVIGKVGVQPR